MYGHRRTTLEAIKSLSSAEQSRPGYEEMHEYPTSRDNILSNFRLIMAAAILRFGMVFYGVVLVMLVLCNSGKSVFDLCC